MKIRVKMYAYLGIVVGVMILTPCFAWADGWWGKGYKSSKWILNHGGTIIRYEIDNISGEENEYKIVMYDNKGKYVEVEYGTEGLLDDAKDGVYTIKADRGIKDTETYRGGRSFAAIEVIAHPGETINLKFNYKKKKVKMTTDYIKPVPKKPIQKQSINEKIENSTISSSMEIEPDAEVVESDEQSKILEPTDSSDNTMKTDNEESVMENLEELVHLDALAMEIEQQPAAEKEKVSTNIVIRIWDAIKKIFGFKK